MKKRLLGMAGVVAFATASAQAGVIVSETFDTDGSLDDYTGAGEIFADYVSTGTPVAQAVGGEFNTQLIANQAGELHTRIDLGGAQSLLSVQLDYKEVDSASATNAWSMYAGSFADADDFETNWNPSGGGDPRAWSRITVDHTGQLTVFFQGSPDVIHQLGDGFNTFSMFFNETGADQAFFGPDGQEHTLNTASWTMFVDDLLIAANIGKGASGDFADLQGIVFHMDRNYGGARSNTSMDNIVVRDDLGMFVPEPATLALLAMGGVAMLGRRRRP